MPAFHRGERFSAAAPTVERADKTGLNGAMPNEHKLKK